MHDLHVIKMFVFTMSVSKIIVLADFATKTVFHSIISHRQKTSKTVFQVAKCFTQYIPIKTIFTFLMCFHKGQNFRLKEGKKEI